MPIPHVLRGFHRYDAALGVTILTRHPVRRFGKAFDVFGNQQVKASGQQSYEALQSLARENKPEWLAAGRASLAAQQQIGYACVDDWVYDVWGTGSMFEEFRFEAREPERVELQFNTKSNAPEGVIREIARRFPKANVWAAAYAERGKTIVMMRKGKPIARLVPKFARQREDIERAIKSIKELRKRTGKTSVEEILSARDEGRRF